ncbi:MAG: MBL fold metallo-hydrolase [Deltaproteobacteria bacterium]|nr:MBL fold metallo-hydrolase [Deltaproteobacteria bacterium]MBI3077590.1 MBL fold metallo-hydrolase [Deltaproteobacteria bacterium]
MTESGRGPMLAAFVALLVLLGGPVDGHPGHMEGVTGPVGDPTLPPHQTVVKVTDTVHLFMTPRGGPNASFVVTPAGVVVVDSLVTPALARRLLAEIRKVTPLPVRYVINTHEHSDHVFGNQVFSPPAEIIAHENVRAHYIKNVDREFAFRRSISPGIDLSEVKVTLATLTLSGTRSTLTLHLGGREFQIHHFGPGQTTGDLFIYLPDEKVMFTGDSFNRRSINFMGNMASYEGWLRTLDQIGAMDVRVYVAGHGHPATKGDIAAYREMLESFHTEVKRGVERGASVQELLRTLTFRQYQGWRNYERFVHRNIEGLYKRFAAKP